MERGTVDPTPNLDELLQEEVSYPTVPVRGEGTFLVQQLPSRRVQYATDTVPVGAWTQLLPETPKRARSVLVADGPFYVSNTGAGGGMRWPAGVPLELRHSQRVYVMGASPGMGGDPLPELVSVANPAAGVSLLTFTVPTGEAWEVLAARFFLTTSAFVGNRTPEVIFRSPDGVDYVAVSATSLPAASSARNYNWWQGGAGATGGGNLSMGLPLGFRLPAGSQIRMSVFGMDVADVITNASVTIRRASGVTVSHATELWAD